VQWRQPKVARAKLDALMTSLRRARSGWKRVLARTTGRACSPPKLPA
jgi:hypothetical protein